MFYADHQAPFTLEGTSRWESVVPAILSASLMASDTLENRTTDLWNHPRVPRLEALEKHDADDSLSNRTWTDIGDTSKLIYSSWTGINIQGLRPDRQPNFSVKHSYIYLNCNSRFNISNEIELKSSNISFYTSFERNLSLAIGNATPPELSMCDRAKKEPSTS